jgi:predicted phage tail protein
MEPLVKTRNVAKTEALFRIVIGAILVLFTFFTHGILSWIIGLIGVALIVTAIFEY